MSVRSIRTTLLGVALAASHTFAQTPPAVCPTTHPIMHFSDAWMAENHRQRAMQPVHHASGLPSATTMVDLSGSMDFAACGGTKGWNQGRCGNCWVFASTAALSLADGIASGKPQLFSCQWFDSDYYATGGQSTCNGGNAGTVANWYNNHPRFIPWTNTGAGYADGGGPSTPATPVSSIAQTPYVGIGNIRTTTIATSSVSQTQAIANIKSVLDNNQPVVLMFFLSSAGWSDFDSSWDRDSESTPWSGVDQYSGQSQSGGHLVCVVGYDDTKGIWLVQNSWSTTSARPHGRFALPQKMNYGDSVGNGWDMWEFDYFATSGWSNASTAAPTITTQPVSQQVTLGATATFKVTAVGAAPLSYQWYRGTAAISGATAASYTTPAASAADNGATFHVVISNASGSVTSSSATLTVSTTPTAPTITTQPANLTVPAGASATFRVVATGAAPLTYQWYKGTAAISGATATSYTTPATSAADSGTTFHVVVSNGSGSVTSNNATLTVGTTPPSSNLIVNGGFESGRASWSAPAAVIGQFSFLAPAYAGTWDAWLSRVTMGGRRGRLSQTVAIPATVTQATLTFYLHVNGGAGGSLAAQVCNGTGTVLATLGTYGGSAGTAGYQPHSFDLSAYKGQTIQVAFDASVTRARRSAGTSFVLDNVSLNVK